MKDGFSITGICVGYNESPWKTNPDRLNRQVGIAEEFDGRWGKDQRVIGVDVSDEDAARIREAANKLKGKRVTVHVVVNPRGKGDKTWLSVFMPRGSDLVPVA